MFNDQSFVLQGVVAKIISRAFLFIWLISGPVRWDVLASLWSG